MADGTTSGDVGKLCERKPFKLNVSKEWWMKMAKREGDATIGAGYESMPMPPPLISRLAEVVRHSPECAGYGHGDEHCDCDAVAALGEAATLLTQMEAREQAWREAVEAVGTQAVDWYKKRNGHISGIQDESGEKCWIVPDDAMLLVRALLNPTPTEER